VRDEATSHMSLAVTPWRGTKDAHASRARRAPAAGCCGPRCLHDLFTFGVVSVSVQRERCRANGTAGPDAAPRVSASSRGAARSTEPKNRFCAFDFYGFGEMRCGASSPTWILHQLPWYRGTCSLAPSLGRSGTEVQWVRLSSLYP